MFEIGLRQAIVGTMLMILLAGCSVSPCPPEIQSIVIQDIAELSINGKIRTPAQVRDVLARANKIADPCTRKMWRELLADELKDALKSERVDAYRRKHPVEKP